MNLKILVIVPMIHNLTGPNILLKDQNYTFLNLENEKFTLNSIQVKWNEYQ